MKSSSMMWWMFAAVGATASTLPSSVCLAGPNAGGTLVLHAAEPFFARTIECVWCENEAFCGGITQCSDADTRVESEPLALSVIYIYAAFPEGSSPRMKGVTFGIEYGGAVELTPIGCGDLEIPQPDWPASGSGTALTWAVTRTEPFPLLYVMGVYYYYGTGDPIQVCATEHPTQGGWFGDDSVPAVLDPIADYGCIGFGVDGYLPCPEGPVPTRETTWGRTKARFTEAY